jgi:hypothetical protein
MSDIIYLKGPDGYAFTDNRKMADAMISVGWMVEVSKEEFDRVKATVDAQSGITEGED